MVKNDPDNGIAATFDDVAPQATSPGTPEQGRTLLLLVPINIVCRRRSWYNSIYTCYTAVLKFKQLSGTAKIDLLLLAYL